MRGSNKSCPVFSFKGLIFMINQIFIYPIFPLLPLGNVSGVAYSDKETFLNFCASVIYLFAIHLLMRIAIKRTPAYENNDKEMIVCHILTFVASLAMVLMFGMSDILIKGTAFYLILLFLKIFIQDSINFFSNNNFRGIYSL